MLQTLELARRATRLRSIVAVSGLLALFAGACNSADTLADPSAVAATLDEISTDSLPPADSTLADSTLAASLASARTTTGIPFGPFSLWRDYTTINPHQGMTMGRGNSMIGGGSALFSASINYTDMYGIIKQIGTARALRQKLVLMMTDLYYKDYMTGARFDLAKWKRNMNTYNKPQIKAAVAAGVADGTILGNSVVDEPNTNKYRGSINKALVDQMCAHVKSIFPTLPVGAVAVHWWRPTERYRVCDFIVDQYDWWQPPHGPRTGGPQGNVVAWRTAALAQAKADGVAIMFSLNILDGGTELRGCPVPLTGGRGTYSPSCRMTPAQVREWGLALGPAGCALLLWRFDNVFLSKAANMQALRDVGARMAVTPGRSCRR
jgi:hypothetical protein